MAMFSKETMARLRGKAQAVKAATSFDASRDRWIGLTGKNAIVAPGGDVSLRILPLHDFVAKRYAQRGGKVVDLLKTNPPEYQPDEPCVYAWEHWIDGPDGKPSRRWCRRTLGEDEPCPVCEAAEQLAAGTDEEREQAKRMQAKEVYVFAVVLRGQEYGEDGLPAIKLLPVGPTVWLSVIEKCTGGGDEQYALGDISDWQDGYDVKIHRPATGAKGERYSVLPAPRASRLFPEADKAKWNGFFTGKLIPDIRADVTAQVEPYDELYKWVYGVDPEGGAAEPAPANGGAAPTADPPFEVDGPQGEPEAAGSGDPFAEFFPPGEEAEPAPAPAPARSAPRPAAPPARQAAPPQRAATKAAPAARPAVRRPTR